jgi:hypothetical protein
MKHKEEAWANVRNEERKMRNKEKMHGMLEGKIPRITSIDDDIGLATAKQFVCHW